MALNPGTILNNRYRIVKLVGKGGFGAVYRAWDLNLQKPCAVKENLELSQEALKQFIREAKILSNLTHPNLPRVTDYFSISNQGQYLVMDFVEGDDLKTLIDQYNGRVPEALALSIIEQVADALSYLHTQKPPIIHRDIKPQNIIITPDKHAFLVDFGIVKIFDPQFTTTLGARAYTPGYSPPEQYGQGGTDTRSDVYALGATMYHLLCGQEPPESIQRTTGKELIKPRTLNPSISVKTESIILRAMQLIPSARYDSASYFLSALREPQSTTLVDIQADGSGNRSAAYNEATSVVSGEDAPTPKLPGWLLWVGGVTLFSLLAFLIIRLFLASNQQNNTQTTLTIVNVETQLALTTTSTLPTMRNTAILSTETSIEQTTITFTPPPTISPEPSLTSTPQITPLPGDDLIQLTFDDADYYMPTLSHNQKRLVTFANNGDFWQITEIDPYQGGFVRQITNISANNHHPHFSDDGSQFLMTSDKDGDFDIYVIDSTSGEILQKLTDDQYSNMTPFWSPDEESFVFMSNQDGDYEIFLGYMDGSEPIQLTFNNVYDGTTSFSPDGKSIVFYSNRSGNPDIYLLDIASGLAKQLTTSTARDAEPAFSPDGEWIVFESNRNGNYDIWAIRPDGNDLHQITVYPDNEQIPSVSPDGKWLLYQSNKNGSYDIYRIPWPG
jgi:serine/threonine protein kinase